MTFIAKTFSSNIPTYIKSNLFFYSSVFCLLSFFSDAQSPYSRYGIGDLQSNGYAKNAAMAGTGIAVQNDSVTPFFINNLNPASYTSFRITVFEAGILSNTFNIKNATTNQIKNATSLGYISFGVPFKKWWGGSFGLLPYSNVGYKISDQQTIDSIGNVDYFYEGSGGINRVYLGNAFKVKNFSAGVNASYLFGTLNYASRDVFSDPNYLNTRINKSVAVNDIYIDYGMQYSLRIDSLRKKISEKKDSANTIVARKKRDIEDIRITLGATLALQSDINATSNTLAETYLLTTSNFESVRDTIQNSVDQEGFLTFPFSFGAGLAVKKGNRWIIAGDYMMQKWADYSSFGQNQNFKNSIKVSLGVQFIPAKSNSLPTSYWKKVQYRMGIKYYQTHLELKNTPLDEYAISVGLGLPVGRTKALHQASILNFSFELGQRGTTSNDLIQEQFIRTTIGFTINDRWFIKPKID